MSHTKKRKSFLDHSMKIFFTSDMVDLFLQGIAEELKGNFPGLKLKIKKVLCGRI